MTAVTKTSFWEASSWFAGGLAHQEERPDAEQRPQVDGGGGWRACSSAPGGARAQARFTGSTARPLFRSAPLDGVPVLSKPDAPTPQRHVPSPAGLDSTRGLTCDGSVLADDATRAVPAQQHVSKWVFDLDGWRWHRKHDGAHLEAEGPCQQPKQLAKHQLAARRWGGGRDALVPAAAAAGKRARLEVSAERSGGGGGGGPQPPAAGFAAVGGLAAQKEALLRSVAYPLRHPALFRRLGVPALRGMLLHGPPGTGKSHLARALAAEAGVPCVALACGECAGEEGAARLRRAFNEAKSVAPSILFLDEVDAAAPSHQAGPASEAQRHLAAALVAQVDELRANGARVALLAATSRREAVDAALRRAGRLDVEIAFGALSRQEREEILRCASLGMPLDPAVDLGAFAARLHGHTAADCAAVCTEAALRCAVEVLVAAADAGQLEGGPECWEGMLEGVAVGPAHFEAAAAALGPASLRELAPEVPRVDWSQVGGLKEVKAELAELVELPTKHGALLAAMGVRPPRGALLYGPPGCGKTLLAKAVASQCGANFLSVRGPELLQKWLGESERGVRELFAAARAAAPCVVFFDEVDAVAPRRGGGGGGASAAGDSAAARVLNQLLAEMDGLSSGGGGAAGAPAPLVLVLAATNRPEALDPALLRPGRLDRLLLVPLPGEAARLAVLRASLARAPLAPDVNLASLAAATPGMSGADLAELCRRAGMAAIRELVAAEESALLEQLGAARRGGAGTAGGGIPGGTGPPALLTRRHLSDALAGLRSSVSEADAAHYAALAVQLRQGSLPAGSQRGQGQRLAALVRTAAQQAVDAQEAARSVRVRALQQRVAQLEGLLAAAGGAVPPPEEPMEMDASA
eukprot:scaffold8.g1514.t1